MKFPTAAECMQTVAKQSRNAVIPSTFLSVADYKNSLTNAVIELVCAIYKLHFAFIDYFLDTD